MSAHYPGHAVPTARDVEVIEDRVSPIARIGQWMVAGAGAVLTILGVVTLIRTGIHSDLAQPVVNVWGHTATPWLGIAEFVVGVLLIGLGTSLLGRRSAVVLGVLLIAAGVFALAAPGQVPDELAVDDTFGWIPLAVGVVATVGALLPEGMTRVRSRRIEEY
jgi:dipeptide/tripeptide permease